jgi:quinol monooxygenase YgiN
VKGAQVTAGTFPFAGGPALDGETSEPYVQIAELEIDPAQLEDFKSAARTQFEAAIRLEPGVLVLYAVSQKDDASQVRVFEIYTNTDAYRAHLESDHFKIYKEATKNMVRSLNLIRTSPISLCAKAM